MRPPSASARWSTPPRRYSRSRPSQARCPKPEALGGRSRRLAEERPLPFATAADLRSSAGGPTPPLTALYDPEVNMARMTHATIKSLSAFALLGLTAMVVAGCGNDLPPGAVAKVGDSEITQDEFDKWLKTAVMGQAQGGTVAVPDPPDFTKCVSAKKKAPAPEGQDKPSDSQLKKQCEQE